MATGRQLNVRDLGNACTFVHVYVCMCAHVQVNKHTSQVHVCIAHIPTCMYGTHMRSDLYTYVCMFVTVCIHVHVGICHVHVCVLERMNSGT